MKIIEKVRERGLEFMIWQHMAMVMGERVNNMTCRV